MHGRSTRAGWKWCETDRRPYSKRAKSKDKDGKEVEKWRQTAPAARDVDAAKIEALISAATGARATSFAPADAKTGLDKPELSVAFKYDENKDERVTFARSGTDGVRRPRRSPVARQSSTQPCSTASSRRSRRSSSPRDVSGFRILLLASVLTVPGCATHSTRTAAPPAAPRAVEELRSDLARVFDAPVIQRGVWAVDVMSMATGEHLYRLNADRWMMPASNLKILTLAAAAETLGWDYRFKTTLEARGPIEAGVLKGDLVVRSNGDPTINGRDGRAAAVFREWASGGGGCRHHLCRGSRHR